MVNVMLRVPASDGLRQQILHSLRRLLGPTSVAPGCLSCRLYEEVGESFWFLMHQQWESEQALERHLRSEQFRRLLGVIEAASQAPEIRFDTVSRSQGLELIEAVRLKDANPFMGEAK